MKGATIKDEVDEISRMQGRVSTGPASSHKYSYLDALGWLLGHS